MRFDPERASIRFGCGLSSSLPSPSSVDEMMGWLSGPDDAAQSFEIPGMDAAFDLLLAIRQTRKRIKAAETPSDQEQAQADLKELRADRRQQLALWLGNTMLRRTFSLDGFRERLVAFWTDHFTATGKAAPIRFAQAVYTEDAIRPHVSGRFADMLRAAVTHPLMLNYLDQFRSAGPNSSFAKSRKRKVGLNENLAREIIELHTLGVGASYTQTDVRQFAELLTGFK